MLPVFIYSGLNVREKKKNLRSDCNSYCCNNNDDNQNCCTLPSSWLGTGCLGTTLLALSDVRIWFCWVTTVKCVNVITDLNVIWS